MNIILSNEQYLGNLVKPAMYKNRIFSIIGFLLFVITINAQHNNYFSTCSWDKIVLDKNYAPKATDSCIIFASTRSCTETEKIFMGYDCDKNITIHYFNIYFNGDFWTCVPKQNLKECLSNSDSLNAITFVEGFGRTFLTALDRATLFTRTYGKQIIMFDWPTYRPDMKSGKNFKLTLSESEVLSKTFASFLDTLNMFKKENPHVFSGLSLLMHSMGSLLLMHAVNHNYLLVKDTLFDAVVLTSPCVAQKNHKLWIEKVKMQKRIYSTINNRDRTLRGAKLISGFTRQLGQAPKRPYANNVIYLDFSRVLKDQHNYFLYPSVLYEFPYIKQLFATTLSGKSPNFDDANRYVKKPKKNRIEIFDLKEAQKGGISIGVGM